MPADEIRNFICQLTHDFVQLSEFEKLQFPKGFGMLLHNASSYSVDFETIYLVFEDLHHAIIVNQSSSHFYQLKCLNLMASHPYYRIFKVLKEDSDLKEHSNSQLFGFFLLHSSDYSACPELIPELYKLKLMDDKNPDYFPNITAFRHYPAEAYHAIQTLKVNKLLKAANQKLNLELLKNSQDLYSVAALLTMMSDLGLLKGKDGQNNFYYLMNHRQPSKLIQAMENLKFHPQADHQLIFLRLIRHEKPLKWLTAINTLQNQSNIRAYVDLKPEVCSDIIAIAKKNRFKPIYFLQRDLNSYSNGYLHFEQIKSLPDSFEPNHSSPVFN